MLRRLSILCNASVYSSIGREFSFSIPGLNKMSKIDRSRFPVLEEDQIDEKYVKGSGPGGQNVNKLVNCVQLVHLPTGVTVRCHEHRMLHQNRKEARKMLLEKLDDFLNGEMSVRAQKERIVLKRKKNMDYKRRKQRRERENRKDNERGSDDEEEYFDPTKHI